MQYANELTPASGCAGTLRPVGLPEPVPADFGIVDELKEAQVEMCQATAEPKAVALTGAVRHVWKKHPAYYWLDWCSVCGMTLEGVPTPYISDVMAFDSCPTKTMTPIYAEP